MSQSAKQVMSGLRSVKRDFSSNSAMTSDQPKVEATQAPPKGSQRTISGKEQRLRDIQAALDEAASQKPSQAASRISSSSQHIPPSTNQSASSQKRPSPSTVEPAAKRRQLPSSWTENITPQSSNSNTGSFYKTKSKPSSGKSSFSTAKSKGGVFGVFLSDEQTHILKLVESGQSVFYTGSAVCPSSRDYQSAP
ncbi:hypothetical protein BXZ70DRAFT_675946 [Cristinia sonorae]|uniref:Uncharacterized protein n=1 Tax=Cristinia sonorae TaxID=1940300 RepID=A0A8K0XSN9_9AGAR|nr:hypothetical protein BXZ70DRAFT_675946 [Cristinia sonorae]